MKNKNHQIVYTNYHHADIDNHIAQWKSSTSSLVQVKAKTNAGKKLPKAVGDDFKRYIGFFKEKVQECIRDIDRILKVTPILYSIKQMRHKRDLIVFDLQSKKEELQGKHHQLQPDANHSENKFIRTRSFFILVLLLLLASAEGFLSYKPFLYITGSHFASVTIAIVFAILWTIGAEKFATQFNSGEGYKKILKRVLLVIICSVIFYSIAHLRVLEKACSRAIANDQPIPTFFQVGYFEIIVLTCIGWLFFLGGIWLAMHSPKASEIKQAIIQRYNKRFARRLHKEILKLQAQIDEENEKIAREEHAALSMLNIRKQAIKEVHGHLYYLAEEYKEVNYSSRVDGVYPDCFNEKISFEIDTMIPNLQEDIDFQMENATSYSNH